MLAVPEKPADYSLALLGVGDIHRKEEERAIQKYIQRAYMK